MICCSHLGYFYCICFPNRQYNVQKKKIKRTNNDIQTFHRKLKFEEHEPHKKLGVISGCRANSMCDTRRVTNSHFYLVTIDMFYNS
jgi:hypothetical protein